jgi:hypothetical protein
MATDDLNLYFGVPAHVAAQNLWQNMDRGKWRHNEVQGATNIATNLGNVLGEQVEVTPDALTPIHHTLPLNRWDDSDWAALKNLTSDFRFCSLKCFGNSWLRPVQS